MKNILIANAVPTNNGDAALVIGLYNKLKDSGYNVTISTVNYNTVRNLYPDIEWIKADYEFPKIVRGFFKIFPKLQKITLKYKIKKNKRYKNFDAIIGAPGGYINSYYGFDSKLYCMSLMKKYYNSKLVMYSQSVGPLSDEGEKSLDTFIKDFDLFMVRDKFSYELVKHYPNVIQTNDAAFLLSPLENSVNDSKIVAISVREWKHDGRNKQNYIDLIKAMTYKCIDNGYKVEFVSTCQGISNYVDDSKIAKEILMSCGEKYRTSITVNDQYMSLFELREYIQKFDFVIGTRLHMCILSCLSAVPAFNISYEVKGRECYKILRLEDFSIDYNDNKDNSLEKLQMFINQNKSLKKIFDEKAKEMHNLASQSFNYMVNNILERSN